MCDHCQVELPETALQLEYTRCPSCNRLTEVQPRLRETVRPTRTPPVPKSSQQAEKGSAQELAEATLRLLQGHYDYVDRPPWKAAPSTRPQQGPVGESTVKAPPLTPPCLGALEAPPRRVPRSPDAVRAPMCPSPAADAEDPQELLDKREL